MKAEKVENEKNSDFFYDFFLKKTRKNKKTAFGIIHQKIL